MIEKSDMPAQTGTPQMKLNLELIERLAKKYPEKFTRQQRFLWRHGGSLPSMASLLWLKEAEGIADINVFFTEPNGTTAATHVEEGD